MFSVHIFLLFVYFSFLALIYLLFIICFHNGQKLFQSISRKVSFLSVGFQQDIVFLRSSKVLHFCRVELEGSLQGRSLLSAVRVFPFIDRIIHHSFFTNNHREVRRPTICILYIYVYIYLHLLPSTNESIRIRVFIQSLKSRKGSGFRPGRIKTYCVSQK